MFKRDATDGRVVNIIDFNHLAYKVAYGARTTLSATLMVDGQAQIVDTTIPALTIKTIHRWARYGLNPTAVCFDTKGSGKCRAEYFKQQTAKTPVSEKVVYKDSRSSGGAKFFTGINLTASFLHRGGVSCYKDAGFEADDLVKACIEKAKIMYPTLPIHVITGDTDLIPLVDDQVSVFLRSMKTTYSVEKAHEKAKYVQVTQDNYRAIMEDMSAFKTSKLYVPYNTVLLAKMLRGDKTDSLPGKSDWKPKIYNELLHILERDGYDIGNMFRYGKSLESYIYRDTKLPIPKDLISSTPRENLMLHYDDAEELTYMCDVLSKYVEPEDIEHIKFMYRGMNLNGAITGLGAEFNRRPVEIKTDITGYQAGRLQKEVSVLQVNLPQ